MDSITANLFYVEDDDVVIYYLLFVLSQHLRTLVMDQDPFVEHPLQNRAERVFFPTEFISEA